MAKFKIGDRIEALDPEGQLGLIEGKRGVVKVVNNVSKYAYLVHFDGEEFANTWLKASEMKPITECDPPEEQGEDHLARIADALEEIASIMRDQDMDRTNGITNVYTF